MNGFCICIYSPALGIKIKTTCHKGSCPIIWSSVLRGMLRNQNFDLLHTMFLDLVWTLLPRPEVELVKHDSSVSVVSIWSTWMSQVELPAHIFTYITRTTERYKKWYRKPFYSFEHMTMVVRVKLLTEKLVTESSNWLLPYTFISYSN